MLEKSFRLEIGAGVTAVFVPGAGVLRVTNAELRETAGGVFVYWLDLNGQEHSSYWSLKEQKSSIEEWLRNAADGRPEVRVVLNSVKQLRFVEETETTLTILDC